MILIDENTAYRRLIGIDILKIFAIIMVVLTHTSFYAPFGNLYLNTCVPIFILIAAFSNSRKYNKAGFTSIKEWYNKENFWGYFKRISIPYLFFMLLQVIILPLVGYAPFSEALLNTIKGGMGAGGYYLVVFAQLFLIFPVLIYCFKRKPLITFLVTIIIQIGIECLFHYALLPINEYIFTGVYKLTFFRYLLIFMLGILFFEKFKEIKTWYFIIPFVVGIALGILDGFNIKTSIFEVDLIISLIQMSSLVFGICGLVIRLCLLIKNVKVQKVLGFISGSTLHILLFQQLYFCCVGVGESPAYLDLPVTLIGGFVIYVLWIYAEKLIKKIRNDRMRKYKNLI